MNPQNSIELHPRLPSTCRNYPQDHQQYFTSKATPKDAEVARRLHDKFERSVLGQNQSDVVQRRGMRQHRRLVSLERSGRGLPLGEELRLGELRVGEKTVKKENIAIRLPMLR